MAISKILVKGKKNKAMIVKDYVCCFTFRWKQANEATQVASEPLAGAPTGLNPDGETPSSKLSLGGFLAGANTETTPYGSKIALGVLPFEI